MKRSRSRDDSRRRSRGPWSSGTTGRRHRQEGSDRNLTGPITVGERLSDGDAAVAEAMSLIARATNLMHDCMQSRTVQNHGREKRADPRDPDHRGHTPRTHSLSPYTAQGHRSRGGRHRSRSNTRTKPPGSRRDGSMGSPHMRKQPCITHDRGRDRRGRGRHEQAEWQGQEHHAQADRGRWPRQTNRCLEHGDASSREPSPERTWKRRHSDERPRRRGHVTCSPQVERAHPRPAPMGEKVQNVAYPPKQDIGWRASENYENSENFLKKYNNPPSFSFANPSGGEMGRWSSEKDRGSRGREGERRQAEWQGTPGGTGPGKNVGLEDAGVVAPTSGQNRVAQEQGPGKEGSNERSGATGGGGLRQSTAWRADRPPERERADLTAQSWIPKAPYTGPEQVGLMAKWPPPLQAPWVRSPTHQNDPPPKIRSTHWEPRQFALRTRGEEARLEVNLPPVGPEKSPLRIRRQVTRTNDWGGKM